MAEQIMIYASSMITAQSVQLTVEQRAMLTAKADRFRELTETSRPTTMSVPVCDAYEPHGVIGYMDYVL
jgi:hypothetical protein